MNFMNYERDFRVSNPYWLKAIRTFIARALLKLAARFGMWAETTALLIAPWIEP